MFETMKALVIKKNFESHYQRYFPAEKNPLSTGEAVLKKSLPDSGTQTPIAAAA